MTLSFLLLTPRGTWPQPLQGRQYSSVSLKSETPLVSFSTSSSPLSLHLPVFLLFSLYVYLSLPPIYPLSINSSPKLCLHDVFVSQSPRSLARRIAMDSHHLRSGPTRRQGPSHTEIITPTTWTHFKGLSQHLGSFDHSFSISL